VKKIAVAISDFAVPAPRQGSIDVYSGYGRALETGLEIHQRLQADRKAKNSNYQAEVPIAQSFEAGGFQFDVSGRIDGFFSAQPENKIGTRIEEIKSSFNVYELMRRLKDSEGNHPYLWQLRTYGYFHWLQTGEKPALNLLLVSSRDFETVPYDIKLDLNDYKSWLDRRLQELVIEAKLAEKRAKRRKAAAKDLAFPFAKPRSGQIELIETIEEGMREERPMLIQAPTGLGKTVGVLYPTLKEALARGQRLVYLTPKNSQHSVAEDAIERLQQAGGGIRAMTLTAKSKMCFKNEPICNPDFCEYAKDHYTKMAERKLTEQIARKKSLTARVFKKIAEENQVCPFELQLEAVQDADAVICDYNYVFAPRSALGRLGGLQLDQQGKPNLVIDEAHNLPSRAMDYYSPALSTFVLEKMREEVKDLPREFRSEAKSLIDDCIRVIRACAPKDCTKPCQIQPPTQKFVEQDGQLRTFLSTYLKSNAEIEPGDVVMRLSFYWSEFTSALEFVQSGRKEFFTTFQPHPAAVKITCCDAAEMLKSSYENYSQVVAFSATLKPFDFYSRLTGLEGKQLKTAEFVSPFPKIRRKVLIIPQISSKYSERERNYPRIAEAIQKIVQLKNGNYFAFFPSFDFMNRVLGEFHPPKGFAVLSQQRGMGRDEISELMEQLAVPGLAHVIFAVQGGVFSEGVDYPGDLVIGAFVIGPPLPNFDLEREKMREYYQENYSAGFDYAYTYPAMAKAVQAAGRVIRSETDRGIIILMDNRFTQASYVKSMPQDWFERSPNELVSASILSDLAEFWKKTADH
jgi:DNA excision repair protein ERCC-2